MKFRINYNTDTATDCELEFECPSYRELHDLLTVYDFILHYTVNSVTEII